MPSLRGFDIDDRLQNLRARGLFRRRITIDGAQGPRVRIGGREFLNFCSNDYLSLAADARVIAALQDGAGRFGAGAGASQLICGRSAAHADLEAELAKFLGRDRALVFSSGYLANLAVAGALISGRRDLIVEDRLNHASLIDASRIAGGILRRYPHADAHALDTILAGARGLKLVLTDALFSMDGDLAPLRALSMICRERCALLTVDDAHGFGVLGETGRGSLEATGLMQDDVPLLVGTFGKALGTGGAFVAGRGDLIEILIQRGRSYIYTTAPPPAVMVATAESLRIVSVERPYLRLRDRVEYFRRRAQEMNIPVRDSGIPIQPIVFGNPAAAVRARDMLFEMGVLVSAIRPPTVPVNSARLRITLNAGHTGADIDQLITALQQCVAEVPPAVIRGG